MGEKLTKIGGLIVFFALTCGWVNAQVSISANTTAGCSPLPVVLSVATPDAASISTYAWSVTFPSGNSVTTSDSQYIGVLTQPGSYTVSVTINGNLSVTETNYLTVYEPPVASIAVDEPLGCVPHCVTYSDASTPGSGTIVAWSWDFGNGALSTAQNPEYCYQNPGNYTPFLSVTDEFGCFNSVSMPQLVSVSNDLPVAAIVPDITSDCNPPSVVNFDNNSTGDALISEWNFGNGFTQTTVSPVAVNTTFTAVGEYEVCLTVTNAIGCTANACTEISIVEPPTPTFTVSDNTFCAGATAWFSDTSNPSPANLQWDFDGDGVIDATGANPTHVFDAQGVYSPVLTAVYSANCIGVSDGSVSIEVLPPLSPDFTASITTSCLVPVTVDFTNNSSGQNVVGYEWLINNQSVAQTTDLSYEFTEEGMYDVTLIVQSTQCADTLVFENHITVQPPTVSFNLPAQICTGVPVPINNLVVDSPDPVVSIDWDFDGDGIIDASGANPNFAYDDVGIYVVDVYIETASGCTNVVPASQSIVVQPGVIADFDADLQTACAGEPITFCANGMVPNTIYGWNFGAGGWQNVSFPNDCITYTYQDTGYFDVTLSVYNTACNALIVLEDFIYIPPAVANFTFVQDCANANEFIFESTSLGADSLTWDFGDGSPLLYNDPNPSHVFPGPGTYQVTLIAYNYDTGCEHERVRTVINEENPIVLNVLNPAGCGPHTTGFSSPNSQQFVLWEIDFGNGTTATSTLTANNTWQVVVNSPTGTNSYTNSFSVNWWPQVTFNQAGLYTINVTATDPGGCIYNYTYPDVVNVYNDPIFAQYDAVIIDDCDQVIVNFVPTGNFLENGTWTLGDGTVVDALEFTHEFAPPWDYPFSASFSVSDSFGCASSFADTLDLVAPPVPNFTVESDPSCIAETIQVNNASTGAIAGYLWDFGDPGSADNLSTDANPSHAYLNNGSYTVCLTAENTSGCQQTLCVDNAVNIISPVAEITFTPQIANCLFGVQFENSTEGEYLCSDWSFGDGQFGGGPNPYHTYSIGVYDVELVVCNEFGCYDTTTVFDIFNLSNVIGPFNSVLDDVDCAPFQVEFNAYNSNDAQFTYFWDFGDGSGDPDNNTITNHSYLNPGTYCPSLVMQDPNGCTFLQTCEEPIVVTEFTYELGLATPVCFGETTQFQAEGATGYTFSAPELVTDLGGGFFEVNAPESTEILVTGTFADCQYTLPLEVTIHPLPSVVIELDEGVCFNEEPFALNGGLPAGSTGTYTVNGNETTVFNPSQPADATYEVVYTFTDANGCVNSDTSSIVIWPLPAVSLDPFTPACELDPVLALTGGWPENGVYTLDATEIEELNPSELGYGSYMLEYTFTDANGCAESASELVTIYPSPEPAISPPTLCWEPELIIESSTTIAQGVVSGYTWNLGENGDDSSLPTATLLTDGPGDVTVQLTVVSDQGCEASTSAIIPIHPTPVADFTADDICANEALVVEDLSTIDGGAIADWEWTMNGVLFSNNQQPEDILVEDWGSLLVSLTVTSPQGCASTTSETIMVSPLPVLNLTADAICSGQQATVFSNASLPDGSVPDLEWNNGLGETVSNTLNLTGTYDQPGEYVIALTASSGPGCVTNETINLVVHPTPSVAFIWDENRFCAEGNTLLTDLSDVATGSLVAWYWTANGTPFSQQSEAVFTTAVPGNYTIALTVTTDEGCEAQSVENNAITVWPNPVADFYFPPELPISAAPYVHVTDRSQGANQWLYTFSDGSVYHEPDFTHTFTEPGLYELTQLVTNGFGCTDSMNVSIDFNPSLNVFVPNAFTPDDDGINEVFKPILSGAEVNHYRLVIINRWGEVVFESNDLGEGWIGNFRGGAHYVPAGVYVWQLEVGTREQFVREKFTGHVTVLR